LVTTQAAATFFVGFFFWLVCFVLTAARKDAFGSWVVWRFRGDKMDAFGQKNSHAFLCPPWPPGTDKQLNLQEEVVWFFSLTALRILSV